MRRLVFLFWLVLIVAAPASAQDAEGEPAAQETVEESGVDETADEPEPEPEPDFDETGLDEQGFADEDDDFDPTEEIPTDQSIEFPTDI